MTPPDAFATGARVGSYTILRELGRGAMGVVYEAEHTTLQRRVALKTLVSTPERMGMARLRFAREGRAVARLRHPHVVDVLDAGVHGEAPYLVMELVKGPTFAEMIERARVMPASDIIDVLRLSSPRSSTRTVEGDSSRREAVEHLARTRSQRARSEAHGLRREQDRR